jgi:hypothetical protein
VAAKVEAAEPAALDADAVAVREMEAPAALDAGAAAVVALDILNEGGRAPIPLHAAARRACGSPTAARAQMDVRRGVPAAKRKSPCHLTGAESAIQRAGAPQSVNPPDRTNRGS